MKWVRSGRRPLLALVLVLSVAATLPALAVGSGGEQKAAVVLEAGSIARQQLVALGRDLVIAGEAQRDAAALEGSIHISGTVRGDVIALGGDVDLAPSARVEGDVFTLGGRIRLSQGAVISGRSASYPTASSAWVTLLEGPTMGLGATSPAVIGAKIGLLAAWLVLVLSFFAAGGRQMLKTSESVRCEPFRDFFTGLVGILALVLTALLMSALAAAVVGAPLLILVILLALVLKLWGMVAVFHALGDWLGGSLLRRRLSPPHAATLGLLVLGGLKFVPYLGVWCWTVATLIGVGASLVTKLGRQEPWFEAVPA